MYVGSLHRDHDIVLPKGQNAYYAFNAESHALVGMLITAFLATALEVRDMNRSSPSLETSNSSDR